MNWKAEIVKKFRNPKDKSKDSQGWCSVCGSSAKFVFTSWAIDNELLIGWGDESVASEYLYRESMFCDRCNSSYRVRRLANEIVSSFSPETISFLEFTKQEAFTNLKILEINSVGSFNSMHTFLEDKPNCITTMFVPGGPFGTELDGKSIQNLEELTFSNDEFDLVIHSDTLEHVPRLGLAIDEMYRVLKPGGFCIFTVPVRQSIDETFQRVKSLSDSESINVHPPLYHGRGGGPFKVLPKKEDYLEITSFGKDSKHILSRDDIELEKLKDPQINLLSGADFVFKATKL